VVLALTCALAGAGCSEDAEPTSSRPASTETAPRPTTAVLEGFVRLAEGAELPRWSDDVMAPANRPALPDLCTPPQEPDREPVRRADGDRLAGVLIALSDFETEPPHEPAIRDLTIRNCRLEPSLVVATRGDTLRLTNETNYPFLPNLGTGMMRALLHQRSQDLELTQGGLRTLECGFAASCGRAVVVTLHHPLHGSTDASGHFRIEGVPPGDELKISAWHPLFRESHQVLTLQAGETRRVDLILTPAPPQERPPEPPAFDGPAEDNPANILF
jgi:hypothetical protein